MVVSSYITPKARKGVASGIEGRGLAALAPIGAGEIVAIKGGHIVTAAALQSLPERLQNSEIQIADGFHLVALEEAEYEPVMLFINHSCEPNVGFGGNIVLVPLVSCALRLAQRVGPERPHARRAGPGPPHEAGESVTLC